MESDTEQRGSERRDMCGPSSDSTPDAAGGWFTLRWNLKGWGYVAPALAWTITFFAAPFFLMACYSLWRFEGGKVVPVWTLENYAAFLARPHFNQALVNSLEVAAMTVALSVLLAYPLAWILAFKVPRRWQSVALVLAVLPFWTSYLVRSYSWLLVLSDRGVINSALLAAGIVEAPLELAHNRGATVLGFTHFFTMLLTLTIFASLVQINPHYHTAAADLGASRLRTFLRITLPLSLPGVIVGAFLTFVVAIGDFITPQILGGGTELLMPQAIMLQISRYVNLPMASTMSLILMVVVSLVFFACARWLRIRN